MKDEVVKRFEIMKEGKEENEKIYFEMLDKEKVPLLDLDDDLGRVKIQNAILGLVRDLAIIAAYWPQYETALLEAAVILDDTADKVWWPEVYGETPISN